MLTNSDRTILYGTMAFIAYQLWKSRQGMAGGSGAGCVAPSGPVSTGSSLVAPLWVQQLSSTQGINYFTPQCGMWGRCS